jgi:hypothetical protein
VQVRRIESLASEHPHSIQLVHPATSANVDSFDFNCHAFTFGIHTAPEFRELRSKLPDVVPDGPFVATLIGSLLHESFEPTDGDFVLYFEHTSIRHSGIFRAGRVRSKWGGAHTWEHEIFEVPSSYGSLVRYYVQVPSDRILDAFLAHAATV